MRPLRHVLDLDTRHGAIMALVAPKCNPRGWVVLLSTEVFPGRSSPIRVRTSAGAPAATPACNPAKIEVSGRSSGKRRRESRLGLAAAGLCSCFGCSGALPCDNGTGRRYMARRRSTFRFRKGAPRYEEFSNLEPSTSPSASGIEWQFQMEQAPVTRCFAGGSVERFLFWEEVPG